MNPPTPIDSVANRPVVASPATKASRMRLKPVCPAARWSIDGDPVLPGYRGRNLDAGGPQVGKCPRKRSCARAPGRHDRKLAIRSPAMSRGRVQRKTASAAFHGVSRSICARMIPSRNSAARLGISSGRKTKRDGSSTSSTTPPRTAAAHSGESELPSAPSAISMRRGARSPPPIIVFCASRIVKMPASSSTTSMRRTGFTTCQRSAQRTGDGIDPQRRPRCNFTIHAHYPLRPS